MEAFTEKMIEIARVSIGALAAKIIATLGEDAALDLADNISNLIIIHRK